MRILGRYEDPHAFGFAGDRFGVWDFGAKVRSAAGFRGTMQTSFLATVYKGNIIKNLIMDCQSYTKYRPNETTGGIFVSWRRKEELPTGLD